MVLLEGPDCKSGPTSHAVQRSATRKIRTKVEELIRIKSDLDHLQIVHLTPQAGECFTQLMNDYSLSHRLSLPDGLIAATALTEDIPLYTHNLKDFRYIKGIRLYKEK